jgi:hypothetical protein
MRPDRRLATKLRHRRNDDQRFGIEIVRKTAQMPVRQTAGEDGAVISGMIREKGRV